MLSYIPLISGLYLSRVHSDSSSSLAGFEAVLLALYASETKSRAGKPVVVNIPDLSQPSLYHSPRQPQEKSSPSAQSSPPVGVIWPPLEPQTAVKSTKRACIVGIALDCYFKEISQMPSWSKVEFCEFAASWAGQDCSCKSQFDESERVENLNGVSMSRLLEFDDDEDDEIAEQIGNLRIENGNGNGNGNVSDVGLLLDSKKGVRIPLSWELLQPMLRILGHCLLAPLNSQDVKDAASAAVRCLYARASHDLNPQAILATRSLIQLDKRTREAAKVASLANSSSNANTPSKAKKPEVLLVSK